MSFGALLTKLNSMATNHGSSIKDIPISLQGACLGSRLIVRKRLDDLVII